MLNQLRWSYLSLVTVSLACSTQEQNPVDSFTTVFEQSRGQKTPMYSEVVRFFSRLSAVYQEIAVQAVGLSDSGKPLHLVIYSPTGTFDFDSLRRTHRILLINNGIHPGESDGIDATQLLFRDLASGAIPAPQKTIIATIPVYNIGGALNRNSTSRTNQNGPEAYGFRGNAQNYDLNRDFIKSDTRNTMAFAEIFHKVKPDVFIDNHVSNGADYQYVLTHLFTQHNKLGGVLGEYLHRSFQPALKNSLAEKNWDITPYVNVWGTTPDQGWSQFMDYPRYSTGYTTLWNTLGLMVETHMLKPYKSRVEGTYELMRSVIELVDKEGEIIRKKRQKMFASLNHPSKKIMYPILWELDKTQSSPFEFKGYKSSSEISAVTGQARLVYHQDQPYAKIVNYQDYFIPTKEVEIPKAYIIPQGWWPILERLKVNQIQFRRLTKDQVVEVESYRIKSYDTDKTPYEGHYLHRNTQVSSKIRSVHFRAGDVLVPTDQPGIRYILETLEPEATDSFFNWNFFDTILQQKEHFSPYVWEDKASELLQKNTALRIRFNKKKQDLNFANNAYAQLDWLHKHSEHYEKAHLQYPVYRIPKFNKLPLD